MVSLVNYVTIVLWLFSSFWKNLNIPILFKMCHLSTCLLTRSSKGGHSKKKGPRTPSPPPPVPLDIPVVGKKHKNKHKNKEKSEEKQKDGKDRGRDTEKHKEKKEKRRYLEHLCIKQFV